jgi:carbon-monoxide dehydrogenase large subunit
VQSAFADAAHVTRASLEISRVTACTMEPRAALGECGADGRLTLTTGTQNPFDLRRRLATVFGVEPEAVRVVAPDVGGSFGMKGELYREDVLVLYAARRLGRPVLWISSRTEAFLSDAQGREGCVEAELALNDRHEFTALRTRIDVDVGAYLSRRSLGMQNNIGGLAGAYRTPAIFAELRGVHTNTTPISPYRGNGRPEATYILERLIDQAARELAVDPFMLRKQNLVTPDQMPFRTGLVFRYDCGNFPATMDRAAELAELDGIAARREDAMKRGMLRGVGISNPIESASSPARNDIATIVAAPDGGIEVRTGAVSTGQGMETVLPRIVGDALGVDPSRIRYLQADSDVLANGRGAGGSGGLGISGSAVSKAVDALVEKARALAADALEAAVEDIEHTAGTFAVAGTDRTISLAEVARRADHRNGLSVAGEFLPPAATFPNGCHIAEVEIDPDTGAVRVVRYVSVEDVGNVVNQVIVDGQLMGGIVQGMGQALGEEIHYDADSGQLLTGSFQDYPMPRAQDIPEFKFDSLPVPTAINPFGAKGVGEAGTVGALSAVMNAVNDALASAGAEPIDMPSTPARVWKALARATGRAGQSPD